MVTAIQHQGRIKLIKNLSELPIFVKENFNVLPSDIHGAGLFAKRFFADRTELGPIVFCGKAKIDYANLLVDDYDTSLPQTWRQTASARYINHSDTPNIEFVFKDAETISAICSKPVLAGQEIAGDYRVIYPMMGLSVPPWL